MSHSPSYSPVLDEIGQQCNNMIEDPVLNPFYYAQDRESWYAEVAAEACEESRQKKIEKKKMKKKKNKKPFKNTTFITRKDPGHVHKIIKIIIYDVDGRQVDEMDSDPDSASVNIQYLVRSDVDEIMSETDYLVNKIAKKLSSTSCT